MSSLGKDEAYLGTGSQSTDGAPPASSYPRPLFSRRARQIQADEGILPANVGRVQAPDGRNLGGPLDFDSARSNRGRARAGTLPSSWGNFAAPSLTVPPAPKAADAPRVSLRTGLPLGLANYPHEALSLAQPPPFTNLPSFNAEHQNSNSRIRSGSLTLADDDFSKAFGPSIFSTWQPSRLSSLAMTAEGSLNGPVDGVEDDYASRDNFDESSTLDYLGLADAQPRPQEGSSALRNRASTLASSAARPRIGDASGRARSSSFMPGFQFDHVQERDDPISPTTGLSTDQEASLAMSALQNRYKQYDSILSAADYEALRGLQSGFGARPRATSMGGLDGPVSAETSMSPPGSATLGFQLDEGAMRHYAMKQNIDPNAFVSFAQSSSLRASVSGGQANQLSSLAGRHRAGTIAAMSGPGGRQRTEQELTRMWLSPAGAQKRNARSPTLSSIMDAPSNHDPPAARSHGTSTPSVQRPGTPGAQATHPPSRSLYIGQLSPSTTGQELMQAFAPYGAIDTLRLLPDKECGFINFVDMQDAINAKEVVMNRLGGKIGLRSTSQDGAIRIGFGKVDAIPQGGLSLGAGGAASRGVSSPKLDQAGGDPGSSTPTESLNDQPTRALWIGSIPANTSLSALLSVFTPFGPVESVRVLASKNCGFINFERVDDAVRARKALHGRDVLGAKVGGVRIGFAKVPTKGQDASGTPSESTALDLQAATEALANLQGASTVSIEQQIGSDAENYRSKLVLDLLEKQRTAAPAGSGTMHKSSSSPAIGRLGSFPTHSSSNSIVPSSDKGGVPLPAEMKPQATTTDWQLIIRHLDEGDPDLFEHLEAVARPRGPATYYTKILLVSDSPNSRKFDSAKLRELRKTIESSSCTQADIDNIARSHVPDIVDLSSDYIGNTLVQKFFDRCSDEVKVLMLDSIAPHLAKIGIHKNGTWAAQKIIDCATTDQQRMMIAEHLRPYVPPLLTDQFGNYVVQKVIPFGSPHADFIFDAMIDRCWEVAQGRFGARSMRAMLESSQASRLQQKRVAAAIILNSVPLATSQNGALLVTWLLDSAPFPGRFRLLVPRFTPHLVQLCIHKLASLTLLRIITQTVDTDASKDVLRALLDPARPQILEDIVKDQLHGSQFVSRLLASNALDAQARQLCSVRVSELLIKHRLLDAPPYRSLVENLGLSGARGPSGVSAFGAAGGMPPPPVAATFGTHPHNLTQPQYADPAALGLVAGASGMATEGMSMRELDHVLAQASMQAQYHHPQGQGSRPASQRAGKPSRPSLFAGMTDGGPVDFVDRHRSMDGRRSQSFQSNGVLRSPSSDAFNPWAPSSKIGSPEMSLSQPPAMSTQDGNGDATQHAFYSAGADGAGPGFAASDAALLANARGYSQNGDGFANALGGGFLPAGPDFGKLPPVYGMPVPLQHQHHHHPNLYAHHPQHSHDAGRPPF